VAGAANLQEIGNCKVKTIDTTHLDIQYPTVPSRLDMPNMPDFPCDDDFLDGISPPASGCGDGTTVPEIRDANGDLVVGNVAIDKTTYGGSATAQCYCNFDTSTHSSTQTLPHYLLVDLQLTLADFAMKSSTGVIGVSLPGNSWEFTLATQVYTGVMSACHPLAAGRVVTFGTEDATMECHTYGSPQAIADSLSTGAENIVHHWLSHGGFAYQNANGDLIGVMVWAPMTGTLGQLTSHLLTFAQPVDVPTQAQPEACGRAGIQSCYAETNTCPTDATGYCWVDSSLIVEWKEAGVADIVKSYSLV